MTERTLGIDVGSTTLKLCLLSPDNQDEHEVLAHEGDLPKTLATLFDRLGDKVAPFLKGMVTGTEGRHRMQLPEVIAAEAIEAGLDALKLTPRAVVSMGGGVRRRASHLAAGAALVALPLRVGQAWARWDYHRTRDVQARRIIDAAERYLHREGVYPDELDELVTAGLLPAVPEPAIGFGFLDDAVFEYRGFGTSFILEFTAPRWVECAYTPPYRDDEDGEPADPTGDGDSLGEAWSCPSAPPELW